MTTALSSVRVSANGTGHEHSVNGRGRNGSAALAMADSDADLDDPTEREGELSLEKLRAQNEQLQLLLDQARERLQQAERAANHWKVREQEYESLLEEKSEVIRQLHAQIEHQAPGSVLVAKRTPRDDELIALQQELEQEREQLRQDEEALMAEMRNMEITMSRERADLARQRSELQRMQNELKLELEAASRDAALREKLAPLYRLQEEFFRRKSHGDLSANSRPGAPAGPPAEPPAAEAAPPKPARGKSGFLRRLFSGGG